MMRLRPNISLAGRVARAVGALLLAIAAGLVWRHLPWVAIGLGGSAAFMAFEAARGWCVARACGIRTPL